MDCIILQTERAIKNINDSVKVLHTFCPPHRPSGSVPCHLKSLPAVTPAMLWQKHMPAQVHTAAAEGRCVSTPWKQNSPLPPKTKPLFHAGAEADHAGCVSRQLYVRCAWRLGWAPLPHYSPRSTKAAGGSGLLGRREPSDPHRSPGRSVPGTSKSL